MIQYCYTMGYCEELLNNDDDRYSYISRTHTNAEMYAKGHKYGIAGLKATAAVKFEATLVIEYGLTLLDPNTLVATELIALIAIVYGGTPESDRRLRDQVIPKIQVYWATLAAMGDFRSLISRYPEFMLDMVNASRS